MNESQARSWERHRADFVVEVPRGELSTSIAEGAVVDWADEFGREAPLIVEIGSGAGDSLVPMAAGRPEANLTIERVVDHAARVGWLTGDDVDLVALADQRPRELVHPRGGGVALGREVVREVGEAHGRGV